MQLLILVADYANLTADGKLNVMGIFRQVNARKFPAVHPFLTVIVKLQADLGEELDRTRALGLKLLDEDANEIVSIQKEFRFPNRHVGPQPEFNAIFALNNVRFPAPGHYEFVVLVDNDHKGASSLYVNQIGEPPAPT